MCQNGRDQPDAASIGSVPAWFWHSAAYLQGNVLTPLWRKLNRTRFQSVWNTFIGIKSIFVRLSTPVIIFIKTAQVLRLLRKSRWAWFHDDVIKWKHFPRYWPFVRGIHRSPVNSPHQAQWCGALVFSLICVWIINKRLSKHSWGWWFETLSRPLWPHHNVGFVYEKFTQTAIYVGPRWFNVGTVAPTLGQRLRTVLFSLSFLTITWYSQCEWMRW